MSDTPKETAFAIFADDNGQSGRLQYTTLARDAEEALEIFADDVMSTERSVEAEWSWHVVEIPTDLVGLHVPEEDVYAYTNSTGGTRLATPMQ